MVIVLDLMKRVFTVIVICDPYLINMRMSMSLRTTFLNLCRESDKEAQLKMEDDYDVFTESNTSDLAKSLSDAHISYKSHVVKNHDMKDTICLDLERLGVE
ncbi:hypothetical protein Mp_1g05760 [Marchantia polymorpha subsp. ruderalis]|uniref:Uncharacterized protein n=2 Tax=Marchantia polymorpha TaxID=3197 RepID=A0AAF6ALX4_MARPO|nr:hypothetical protein MARPO_0005s0031 [Marchantia polymorpha]BBM97444.1 hypothetical protein Mp_1g05760 [Marchantia polymorpha subsp. ruderalis]|eukprot:PTQ48359.1 hypothetical protein MARPO_0005s0031 [Marchantia polymorpha]